MVIWLTRERTPSSTDGLELVPAAWIARSDYVEIERGDVRVVCRKQSDEWHIVEPIEARSRAGAVTRVLSALGEARQGGVISAEERRARGLTLTDYGLAENVRVRVVFGNAQTNVALLLGKDTPLDDLLYAMMGSSDDVTVISTNILSVLPNSVDELREKQVMHGEAGEVVRFEIEHAGGGFVRIVKKEDQWIMQQPEKNANLNRASVLELLKQLYSLEAQSFVHDGPTLDEGDAELTVTTWTGQDDVGTKLLLGDLLVPGVDGVYARLGNSELLYTVDADIVETFSMKNIKELRDRTVFPVFPSDVVYVRLADGERSLELRKTSDEGWLIVEPRYWKANEDIVEELVVGLTSLKVKEFISGVATNLEGFGLDEEDRTIEVAMAFPTTVDPGGAVDAADADDAEESGGQRLMIGRSDEETGDIYAKFKEKASVLRVAGESLRSILEGRYPDLSPDNTSADEGNRATWWVSPLLYCDKCVIKIVPSAVTSISLVKDDTEQRVIRDSDGAWRPSEAAHGNVVAEVVPGLLSAVSSLQAMRIEYHDQDNMARYGLTEPIAKLTFGFSSGSEDIRKTIVIGSPAGKEGVYAMVQGRDVIFVVPREFEDRMTRDLVSGAVGGG